MLELLTKYTTEFLDVTLDETQIERFQLYYTELLDWNSRMNLTAITEYEAVQIRHFLDSLTLASPKLRGETGANHFAVATARLIDIGAGAGFPGLPLKILYPKMGLTVVDSVGKKMNFVGATAQKLGFDDVIVLHARAEELGQNPAHREKYDIATGRAVAAYNVLAEYCLPLCKVGGLFIAPKKGDLRDELKSAGQVTALLGGKLRSTPDFELPGEPGDPRRLVVAQKVKPTPAQYPRRTGVPSAQPLKG
jgi:16S rRNA (guanine527-N7)-methyltransferase